ncbi:MAG: hypothetical protein ACTHPD_07720, partial [Rhizomicrobium sp.]
MLKALLHRFTRNFASRYNYDATYMHEMADASASAFVRFGIMQSAGGSWRGDAPPKAWFASGISGALYEDCGQCVQIASDIAMEQGMP